MKKSLVILSVVGLAACAQEKADSPQVGCQQTATVTSGPLAGTDIINCSAGSNGATFVKGGPVADLAKAETVQICSGDPFSYIAKINGDSYKLTFSADLTQVVSESANSCN